MGDEDFTRLLEVILQKVTIVPNELIRPHKEEALGILQNIDIDDISFIACALAYKDSVLWSDDKGLKRQTRIRIISTKEAMSIL